MFIPITECQCTYFFLLLFLLLILFFFCHSNKKSFKLSQTLHSINTATSVTFCPSQEQSGTGHRDRSPRGHGDRTHTIHSPQGVNIESQTSLICMFKLVPKLLTVVGSRRSRRSGIRSPRRQLHCRRRWLLGYGEIPTLIRLWCVYVLGKIKGQMCASRKVKYHKI